MEKIKPADYNDTNCSDHRGHNCQPESFFDHLFENGARIESDGNYLLDEITDSKESQIYIYNSIELSSLPIRHHLDYSSKLKPLSAIVKVTNPRSPPYNS